MTSKHEDLAKRIEGPEFSRSLIQDVCAVVDYEDETADAALCGSLDACAAIMREVLPGWLWAVGDEVTGVSGNYSAVVSCEKSYEDGEAKDPARAWLAAIAGS